MRLEFGPTHSYLFYYTILPIWKLLICKLLNLNLPTSLSICHPTYQSANIPANLPTKLSIYLKRTSNLPTLLSVYQSNCQHENLPTCLPADWPTCLPAYLPAYLFLLIYNLFRDVLLLVRWVAGVVGNIAISAQLELELTLVKKTGGGRKKITAEIVANNFVDSRPPNSNQLQG